jgi:predicted secreted protein
MPAPPLQVSGSTPGYVAKLFVAPGGSAAITAISETGTTVTATSTLHPTVGSSVTVSGVPVAGYNGAFVVVSSTTTQFTYTAASGLGVATPDEDSLASVTPVNFGELQDININEMRDMLDATSHDAQGAKVKKPGLYDWNASAKGLFLAADVTQVAMREALRGSTPLYINIYPQGVGSGLLQYQGVCYIKDMKFAGPQKDLETAEFSLEGSGFLAESTQA